MRLSGTLPASASVSDFIWYKDGTAMAYRVDATNDNLPDVIGRGGPYPAYTAAKLNTNMVAGGAVGNVYRYRP
ncbi:hypothetical protein PLCT1_02742 [Planctomycetaceae bacterium]|nr:hypothetical protein PLCT1_02742 [Planctomycetaceae bacterium]